MARSVLLGYIALAISSAIFTLCRSPGVIIQAEAINPQRFYAVGAKQLNTAVATENLKSYAPEPAFTGTLQPLNNFCFSGDSCECCGPVENLTKEEVEQQCREDADPYECCTCTSV
ncbi:hypothetical protein Mapa_017138 [Marchantia paleacea]|nr:hypothetical protein Mapa_017138 [Marchantia paleacea]